MNSWYQSSMVEGDVKEVLAVPVEKSQVVEKKVAFETPVEEQQKESVAT